MKNGKSSMAILNQSIGYYKLRIYSTNLLTRNIQVILVPHRLKGFKEIVSQKFPLHPYIPPPNFQTVEPKRLIQGKQSLNLLLSFHYNFFFFFMHGKMYINITLLLIQRLSAYDSQFNQSKAIGNETPLRTYLPSSMW